MRNTRSFYEWDEVQTQRRRQQRRDAKRRGDRLRKEKMRSLGNVSYY